MKKIIIGIITSITFFLVTACGPGQEINNPGEDTIVETEPVTIKLAMFPYNSYAPLYIAIEEGFFAEQNIEIELSGIQRNSEALVALSTGQIDVTASVIDVGTLASIASGSGIKIVADKGVINPESNCPFGAWLATDDLIASGELDDIKNIVGKKVVLTKAGFFEFAMDKLLEPSGLSVNDLEIVEMPAPSRLEAIQTDAVDISQMGEPWITRTLATGEAGIWVTFEDNLPGAQYSVIYFGSTITENNPEAGKRFMVAYLKAIQMYNEGKTDRNVELMAELTNADIEEAKTACWQTFAEDGSVNLDTILEFQEWAIEKGYLDNAVPVEDFWDGQYLEYAESQLP